MTQSSQALMKKTVFFLCLFTTCAFFSGWSFVGNIKKIQPLNDELVAKIETYIQAHVENKRFSGSLLVAKGDSIIFQKSYGFADHNLGLKNNKGTKYLIGSITKPFTAYAVLLLEKNGLLSINDKLSKFFPEYPNAENISIAQLLTHTAGIPDYHICPTWKKDGQKDITPAHTIETLKKLAPRFEPGARFEYSNSGYILLGLIIEQVSHKSFENYLQENIIAPLHLKNTGVVKNDVYIRNLAKGYRTSPRSRQPADYINYNQPFSSGNMYSTPEDLWKFTKAVMKSELLPREKTNDIFLKNSGKYGYGWGIRKNDNDIFYGHHGGMNGFVGSTSYFPADDYFICFLKNDENAPWYTLANDLVKMISGAAVSTPEKQILAQPSAKNINELIGKYLIKQGDTLSVFTSKNKLYMQETGQYRHQLFPIGNNKFVFTQLEFIAQFSPPEKHENQWLKFKGAINLKATKIKQH